MKFSETIISENIRNYFLSRATLLSYKRNQTIIYAGDSEDDIYYVLSGVVAALHQNINGKHLLLKKFYKSDIVGYYAGFSKKPRSANVVATKEVEVLRIPSDDFHNFVSENPTNAREMIYYLSSELYEQTNRYKDIGLLSVEERVISYLLQLADDRRIVMFDQPRQDIADTLGMSRETLSRTLSQLLERKHIKFLNNKSILLLNEDSLRAQLPEQI